MRKVSRVKIAISIIATICNVAMFCWLIYEIFRNPPTGSEIFIPVVFGLFLILNVFAITLTFNAHKTAEALPSQHAGSSKTRLTGLAILFFACIGLGVWLGFRYHGPIRRWKWQRVKQAKVEKFMGKKAPDVVVQTLEGTDWRLQDRLGKVVLIDFWATRCGPCVGSIPQMKEIYEKYKSRDDFVMVGISLDHDKQELVKFCEKYEIPWTQLFEADKGWANSVAGSFEVRGIPSVWIIDKEGNVNGMDLHSTRIEEIERIIEESLNKEQTTLD